MMPNTFKTLFVLIGARDGKFLKIMNKLKNLKLNFKEVKIKQLKFR
jgi:hypothetical protein